MIKIEPDGWIFFFKEKENNPFIVWSREAAELTMKTVKGISVQPFTFTKQQREDQ